MGKLLFKNRKIELAETRYKKTRTGTLYRIAI